MNLVVTTTDAHMAASISTHGCAGIEEKGKESEHGGVVVMYVVGLYFFVFLHWKVSEVVVHFILFDF